jgi:hypothetical protein
VSLTSALPVRRDLEGFRNTRQPLADKARGRVSAFAKGFGETLRAIELASL